jgi:hypothetical protein
LLGAATLVASGVFAESVAASESAADVFEQFTLFGTWSPDCSKPASADNPRIIWKQAGSRVVHGVSFDDRTLAIRDSVGSAQAIDKDTVLLSIVRNHRPFATVTIGLAAGRLYIVQSIGADGRLIVDHGVEVATAKPALTDELCGVPLS